MSHVTRTREEDEEMFFEQQLFDPETTENARVLIRRKVSKKQNANDNIDEAFELIGGVPRMAHWAHQNPTDFFTKVYTKRMEAKSVHDHTGTITIRPALAPSALDDCPIAEQALETKQNPDGSYEAILPNALKQANGVRR